MHCAERNKPSNTARLVCRSLPNSEIRYQGEIGRPLDLSGLDDPNRELLILYPEASAAPLTKESVERLKKPVTLLVPDGTWKQAKKIAAYATHIPGAHRVCVPSAEPSRYRLRTPDRANQLCTLEAIARALEVLDGKDVRDKLEALLEEMVERVLKSRSRPR